MDMRALKVGQKVLLSDVLPGGTSGEVTEVTKWHVSVAVSARLDGVDGWYVVEFNYDGSVANLFDWIDTSVPGWDRPEFTGPIPGLKIIGIKEDAA
jgi:hypothetical protein